MDNGLPVVKLILWNPGIIQYLFTLIYELKDSICNKLILKYSKKYIFSIQQSCIMYILSYRGNRDLTQNGEQIGVQQYGATLQYGLDVQTNEWSKVIVYLGNLTIYVEGKS